MEELQSTEILDREILEDARKKAQKILKTAEDTIKTKSADWENKLKASLSELEKTYARQGKIAADEIMARLPIDKRRIKAKKIEEMLSSAVKSWYEGLSRGRVLELLKKELEKRLASGDKITVTGGIRARIHHIEQHEAETLLKTVLPRRGVDTSGIDASGIDIPGIDIPGIGIPYVIEKIHSDSPYPEIIVETQEARIYVSISKIIELFLDEKRAELIEALLGKDALLGQGEES